MGIFSSKIEMSKKIREQGSRITQLEEERDQFKRDSRVLQVRSAPFKSLVYVNIGENPLYNFLRTATTERRKNHASIKTHNRLL